MKFLIAGYGSIGRRHLRNIQELGEHELVLLRSKKSTLSEEEIAGLPVETTVEAALAHRPDAVVIANPTALHLDVAIPAARAGVHILMEKPVSGTLERLDELENALKTGGAKLLVGFQFRFHPSLALARQFLADQVIGRPLSVRVEWGEYLPAWHPWEDYRRSYSARADLGGGVALTLSHPFDYLRWLFGEPSDLWAISEQISDLDLDVDDVAEVGLRFESGVIASVHLDYYRRQPVHRFEIVGTRGLMSWDNADGSVKVVDVENGVNDVFYPPEGFERNWLFVSEMRHFMDVVQGRSEPVCTLEDGLRAQQIALAVHRASAERRMLSAAEMFTRS